MIGCDTVVDCDGAVFGKPSGEEDAVRMLHALSGQMCIRDRYKGIILSIFPALRGLVGGFAAQKPISVPLLATKVQGVPAVSYTHLDV